MRKHLLSLFLTFKEHDSQIDLSCFWWKSIICQAVPRVYIMEFISSLKARVHFGKTFNFALVDLQKKLCFTNQWKCWMQPEHVLDRHCVKYSHHSLLKTEKPLSLYLSGQNLPFFSQYFVLLAYCRTHSYHVWNIPWQANIFRYTEKSFFFSAEKKFFAYLQKFHQSFQSFILFMGF